MAARDSNAAQALQGVPFFANCTKTTPANWPASSCRGAGPNQVIFHLGDPGGLLYLISRGKVKISHTTPDGQEVVLAILGPGDFFGEMALLDDSPRSATAVALEPTETWTLHRGEFMSYLSDNPDFTLHVLKTLARHIRRLNTQLADIFFLDLPGRLARVLLNLAQQSRKMPDGYSLTYR
jgi:CRP/FNR family transcriptional regulator/CRP/FNR family cyclic AMP-dependent transcriptional regulator